MTLPTRRSLQTTIQQADQQSREEEARIKQWGGGRRLYCSVGWRLGQVASVSSWLGSSRGLLRSMKGKPSGFLFPFLIFWGVL